MQNDGAFKCGHPRTETNTKNIRNNTGVTCRQCFAAMDREYRRHKRAATKGTSHDPY